MRIMALDASLSSTGYAIFDTELADFTHVDRIRTSIKKATPTTAKRIESIVTQLSHLMFWNAVDIILIEDIYVGQLQASSVIPLAMLRGAIQETVYGLDYDTLWVSQSSKIKKEVVGKGNASKQDVYDLVKDKYSYSSVVKEALGDELISKTGPDKNEDKSDAVALIDGYLSNPSIVYPA